MGSLAGSPKEHPEEEEVGDEEGHHGDRHRNLIPPGTRFERFMLLCQTSRGGRMELFGTRKRVWEEERRLAAARAAGLMREVCAGEVEGVRRKS